MDNMDGAMELGGGGTVAGARGMLGGAGGLSSGAGAGAANGGLNEKLAISAIQKSLMQFENVVKSPPQYPTQQMVSRMLLSGVTERVVFHQNNLWGQ